MVSRAGRNITEVTTDQQAGLESHTEHLKFKCSINEDAQQEIIAL